MISAGHKERLHGMHDPWSMATDTLPHVKADGHNTSVYYTVSHSLTALLVSMGFCPCMILAHGPAYGLYHENAPYIFPENVEWYDREWCGAGFGLIPDTIACP